MFKRASKLLAVFAIFIALPASAQIAEVGGMYLFPKGFKITSNAQPNIQSSTPAASVTSSSAAFKLKTLSLDANDAVFSIQNSSDTVTFKVDYEGDVTATSFATSTITISGNSIAVPANNTINITAPDTTGAISLNAGSQVTAVAAVDKLRPGADAQMDLGTTTHRWNNAYIAAFRDANNTVRWSVGAGATGNVFRAGVSDTSGAVANWITNSNTLTEDDFMVCVSNDNGSTCTGGATPNGFWLQATTSIGIADNGGGTNATATITPTSNDIQLTCSDAQGCDITMGETGMRRGYVVRLISTTGAAGAGENNFADTAGVSELAGAFAAETNDNITLYYSGSTWIESGRSNN